LNLFDVVVFYLPVGWNVNVSLSSGTNVMNDEFFLKESVECILFFFRDDLDFILLQ